MPPQFTLNRRVAQFWPHAHKYEELSSNTLIGQGLKILVFQYFLLKHPLVLSSPLPFPCVLAWVGTCARTHAGIVQRLVSPLKCSPPSQAHWSCQFSLTRQPALRISCLHLHRARIIDLVYIWVPRSPSSCAHDGEQALGLLSLFCVSSPRTDSKSPFGIVSFGSDAFSLSNFITWLPILPHRMPRLLECVSL